MPATREHRRHVVCGAHEIAPGDRRIVEVAGRSVGIFNVAGRFYALLNRCPHRGGALCEGPICGTALPTEGRMYAYGRDGEVLRCAWHGWEFEIESGRSIVDSRLRAKTFPVTLEDGAVVVHI